MTSPYSTDIVPALTPFFGDNTEARDVSCLIVQFTGYVITDREYGTFRAQVMALVHLHMSQGWGGVAIQGELLAQPFTYNETHALWLMTDLHMWGFVTRPWFLVNGDTDHFMSVEWGFHGTAFNSTPEEAHDFSFRL
jgi:hypothetical protein